MNNKNTIAIQLILTYFIYILIRYQFKTPSKHLTLKKKTIKNLITSFEPFPMIENIVEDPHSFILKYNFASYDIFNFRNKFKDEIKEIINKYGIGTCGPRGFYGTLDIHLELEDLISSIFKKEGTVLYSNHYLCIQSVVACFCKPKNTVYFHKNASEAILRGLQLSKAGTVQFSSLSNLKENLSRDTKEKYVILERLSKNTGELADLKEILGLRREYGFRLILDVSFSMPFIDCETDADYGEVDIIVGSTSHGWPSNGGFSSGSAEVVEYQRLNGAGYVFSASLPAFLAKAAICFMSTTIDYSRMKEKVAYAFDNIEGIESDRRSPILLVKKEDVAGLQRQLCKSGYVSGVNGEYLRICINENTPDEHIKCIGEIINKYV